MSINETEFHRLADAALLAIADSLEEVDQNGALEAELTPGVLNVHLSSGKEYIVSKHTASKQLWVSSPVSGGLHFSWDGNHWLLSDKRELTAVLSKELGVEVIL